ncbi:hypothetical protein NQL31_007870 [Lotmaria passim]
MDSSTDSFTAERRQEDAASLHVSSPPATDDDTQRPLLFTAHETEVSFLPASSPAILVEETETFSRVANPTAEDASESPEHETAHLPLKETLRTVGAGREPALLGAEASQDLLEVRPAAVSTGDSKEEEEDKKATAMVMTDTDDDEADLARGTAIQDKYGATSAWVESLPLAATATAQTRCGKRAREKRESQSSSEAHGGGTLRQRRAREKAAEAELQNAFKHSQRALRKQAKSVNMRDVFARSITLPSPPPPADANASTSLTFPPSPLVAEDSSSGNGVRTAGGNVFSPSSPSFRLGTPLFSPVGALSPTTPLGNGGAWSPCVVGELTNQFLANVKHQRRQKCELFVSRELTQSQTMSQARSLHTHPYGEDGTEETGHPSLQQQQHLPSSMTDGGTANGRGFPAPVDELVIGDEDNEAANWMPAEASSPASLHGRRMVMRDTNANDDIVLLGGSSAGEEGCYTTSPSTTASESRKAEDLASQQHQQQVVQSLSRKHEIWKLKQRQLKAQQQVDLDERAKAKQQQQLSVASSTAASATFASATVTTSATTWQGFIRTSQISSPAGTAFRTLHKANLSPDAISMIRRLNSFDSTSAQRVVVFGTAASTKQSKDESTQ